MTPEKREGFDEDERPPWEVDADHWDDPDPLPGDGVAAPFRSEALGSVGEFVDAVAEETGTPTDLAALAVLGTVSTLIAGAAVVEGAEGWHESINLYLSCLAAPGEGKTPVMKRCCSVLDTIEAERRERLAPEIFEAEAMHQVAEGRKRDAVTRASKAARQDLLEAEEAVREAAREVASILVPAPPRLRTRDATPEGLVKLLGEQGGRLGVVTDEGVGFFELASRYSATGKGNLDIYLAGFDGGGFVSDRASRESIVIDQTTLTVCLFAQPVVLEPLAKDRQAAGRGLLARFLWSIPSSLVGQRQICRRSVSADMLDAYEDRLTTLAVEAESVTGGPVVLRLDGSAQRQFLAWQEAHEPRLRKVVGELCGIVDWASKLPGQVLRLAGNLHAVRTGTIHGSIDAQTMTEALTLAGYFTSHALAVFGMMRADPAAADARAVLGWLVEHPAESFTLRQIYTSKDWTAERTGDAVEVLEHYGWARKAEWVRGPGRPPERWDAHPKLRSKTEQNPPEPVVVRRIAPEIPEASPSQSPPLSDDDIERLENGELFDDSQMPDNESIDQAKELQAAVAASGDTTTSEERWNF